MAVLLNGIVAGAIVALRPILFVWLTSIALVAWACWVYLSRQRATGAALGSSQETAELVTIAGRWTIWTIRFSLILFAAGIHSMMPVLLLAGLCSVAALFARFEGRATKHEDWNHLVVPAFFLMAAFTWVINPGTRQFLVVGVAGFALYLAAYFLPKNRLNIMQAVIDSAAIYLIVSVVSYYFLGIRSPGDTFRFGDASSSLAMYGLAKRVQFPFEGGVVTAPVVAACYFASFLATLKISLKPSQLFRIAGLLCAVIVLVVGNSRISLVLAVVVGFAAYFLPKLLVGMVTYWVAALLLLPFWWIVVVQPGQEFLGVVDQYVPALSRGSEADLATLQDRTKIWEVVRKNGSRLSFGRQMVGYGAQGQIVSGVSRGYAHLLVGLLRNPLLGSAHNSVLQQYLDAGLVGVGILISCCLVTGRRLSRRFYGGSKPDQRLAAGHMAILMTLTGAAAVDTTLVPGFFQGPLWLFMLILVVTMGPSLKSHSSAKA